jgi:7-cyano-7-deazaguanine synthase
MSLVTLVSGGLDSSLMTLLAVQERLETHPLFVDYGQINQEREWNACCRVHEMHGLPMPSRLEVEGWGRQFSSGLTDRSKDIVLDAFLPNRNLLFLLAGSAHAYQVGASAVAIGLLDESTHLFPDQTRMFLEEAERLFCRSLGREIRVVAPLIDLSKADVVALAKQHGLTATYSCHAGGAEPCGVCISCREFQVQTETED